MVYLRVSVLLFLLSSVSDEVSLLTPCEVYDTECLGKTTQGFLEKTSAGIPAYDVKCLDPLVIHNLDIKLNEKLDTVLHFKDLKITGLKGQKFSGLRPSKETKNLDQKLPTSFVLKYFYTFDKMDTTAKRVVLQTNADLNIVGKVTVEMKKTSKSFNSLYSANGTVLGTAKYGYDFKIDDEGVEHYEVGPETNECQIVIDPQVTYDNELFETLEKDKVQQGRKQPFYANQKDIKQKVFCEITANAYKTVVHNIRAAAKILPKARF